MIAQDPSWLIDNITSLIAVTISILALAWSIVSGHRNERTSQRPVLIFEYSNGDWFVENVGNGPAIDITIAFRGDDSPWLFPLRIPPLPTQGKYKIKELGDLNVRRLGTSYTDAANRYYSTISFDDRNIFKTGRELPMFADATVIRHWHRIDLSGEDGIERVLT